MRLSAHDASFLYTETASGPMHGVGIAILDGPATYEEIFDFFAARVHLVPRFRQKLAFVPFNLAHPKWIDDPKFDLANHIKRHEVPPNTTLDRAIDIALELGEPLLDRSRPLWLNYVIENVEGKTLLVQMSHHSFVDGATAVAMSTVLTETSPDASPPEPESPVWQPAPEPSSFSLWQDAVTENAQKSVENAQAVASNARRLAEVTQKGASLMQRMGRPVMQAPWNASLVGPKRSHAVLEHTLDEFKAIRQSLGGTVNDVVVAVVAEGAARYLQFHHEVTNDQYLRLMCPVDVRDPGADPLDMTGNHVSAMFPVLAAWPMSIAERYTAVCAEMNEIKENEEPWILDQMQELQPNTPPVAMAQTLSVGTQWDVTAAAARAPLPIMPLASGQQRPQHLGFNFTCSNVPGPTWTQYIAGRKVETSVGTLMLGGNLGFGAVVGSFAGAMNFGFTADQRLMPDVERMAEFVEEAFQELVKLAEENP